MHISRIIIGALALAMGTGAAYARQLTVAEAAAAAGIGVPGSDAAPVRAALTLSRDGLNTVYVVNTAGGAAVLAADDVAPAVLGYAEGEVNFDPEAMPANLRDWLEHYSILIARAATEGGRVFAAPADPSLADVAPIVKTRWNQDYPYYNLCPMVGNQRTYTGCVATATAQVLKVYEYPVHGTGTHSYTWNNQTLSFDYENTDFKWDLMLDRYQSNSPEDACNAVAELMYGVGVSCNMSYGTGGSGAVGINMAVGLVNNLGYDPSIQYVGRNYYTLPEWSRMLHSELSLGKPLYYDGDNGSVGHAFVIDGYRRTDGFFHVNWGWGGMSDGYYSIVTLDPSAQGIGGSTEGYYNNQSAIFGLKPYEEGSTITPQFLADNIMPETVTVNRGDWINVGDNSSGFFSLSLDEVSAEFGVELTPDGGGEKVYAYYNEAFDLEYGYGLYYYAVPTADIPEGTYTGRPVARCLDRVWPFQIEVGQTREFRATVTSSEVVFTPVVPEVSLEAISLEPASPFFRNKEVYVRATVKNLGSEYYSYIEASFIDAKNKETKLSSCLVDLLTGDEISILASGQLPFLAALGTGHIRLYDYQGNQIGEDVPVEVEKAPTGTPDPRIANAWFNGTTGGSGTAADPAIVNPADINITASLTVGQGYFTDEILAFIVDSQTGDQMGYLSTPFVACAGTTPQELSFTGDFSGTLTKGNTYYVLFATKSSGYYTEMANSVRIYFTAGENSGIEAPVTADYGLYPNPATSAVTVTAPSAIVSTEIYDLAGALRSRHTPAANDGSTSVPVAALAPGNYLMRIATSDGAVKTLRLIKQ